MSFKLFDKWDVTEVTVEDMGLQKESFKVRR